MSGPVEFPHTRLARDVSPGPLQLFASLPICYLRKARSGQGSGKQADELHAMRVARAYHFQTFSPVLLCGANLAICASFLSPFFPPTSNFNPVGSPPHRHCSSRATPTRLHARMSARTLKFLNRTADRGL